MNKIEIDPKLFITCRLCLEDMGVYQIIPMIQQQIKYCFDINVAPFDGLPQLICKQCELKLTEYYMVKTNFVEKQKTLTNKLNIQEINDVTKTSPEKTDTIKNQTELTDSTSEASDSKKKKEETTNNKVPQKKLKRRFNFVTSFESDTSEPSNGKLTDSGSTQPKRCRNWRNKYNTYFNCRICCTSFLRKERVLQHYSKAHPNMKAYSGILKTFCAINLNKVDNNPNITGKLDAVVFSEGHIVENVMNNKYYITYKLKKDFEDNVSNDTKKKINDLCSDSSDDIVITNKRNKRKKVRRLLSTESVGNNQDHNKNSPSSDNVDKNATNTNHETVICINIDSDSDTVSAEYEPVNKNIEFSQGTGTVDFKTMRNIIEACHKKYVKRKNIPETSSLSKNYSDVENLLQHKILSLGSKVINKQGINCTGLLRFMEHRNLNIIWQQKSSLHNNSAMVKINVSKIQKDSLNNDDSDGAWTNVTSTDVNKQLDGESSGPLKDNQSNKKSHKSDIEGGTSTRGTLEKFRDSVIITKQATVFPDTDVHNSKLLNASPVANPKQLPKASHTYELKCIKNKNENNRPLEKTKQTIFIDTNGENTDIEFCMPIITSTTSLAVQDTEAKGSKNNNPDSTNKISQESTCTPRIKVKPVSELMPEKQSGVNKLFINSGLQNNVWKINQDVETGGIPQQTNVNYLQNIVLVPEKSTAQTLALIQFQTPGMTGPTQSSNFLEPGTANLDYVILDTVEMPNTKTSSPFTYFQSLLRIHGISLWDRAPENCSNAICLIKFKVLFKQENVNPVVLCLSLHFSHFSNNIYMTIKDHAQKLINMKQISANWQWEILKIYQGDVSNKVLENALKMGLQVHDCTKNFLSVLQSINIVKSDFNEQSRGPLPWVAP